MPELKRNFLKGKMNKDLDERLVPQGEYRDASNIEISTSEGSNVGSAQTLRGNKLVDTTTSYSSTAITVGTYVDDENEAIYNFVHNRSDTFEDTNYTNYTPGDNPRIIGFKIDSILKHVKNPLTESVTTEIVFNDPYEIRVANGVVSPNNQTITGLTNFSWTKQVCTTNYATDTEICNQQTIYIAQSIKPGMKVQAIDVNGVDLWRDQDIRVVSVESSLGGEDHVVKITPARGYADGYEADQEHYGNNMIADGVVLKFSSDRILDFKGGTEELENNNKLADETDAYSTRQYTPQNNIITGINVIGDLLYWTDGKSEPKKINITNCITGTKYGAESYWKFNPTRVYIPQTQRIGDIATLSNITVIRPAPIKPPTVNINTSRRQGQTTTIVNRWYSTGPSHFALRQHPAVENGVFELGPITHVFQFANNEANFQAGDVIDMVEYTDLAGNSIADPKTASIKLKVYDESNNYWTVDLVAIDSTYTYNEGPAIWKGTLSDKSSSIYPDSFISFAYRYKYTDNEVSVISPYTKPIFVSGKYEYDPSRGFNLGMENQMKSLTIQDFIPQNIPNDVVQVELLYRDTNKANQVNSLKTIKITDDSWHYAGTGKNRGRINIDAELFGSTLPSDQVDRNEDLVPRTAKAQEITESRLMYGNYTEGYSSAEVNINAWLTPKPITATTSTEFSSNIFSAGWPISFDANDYIGIQLPCSVEDNDSGDNYESDDTQPNEYMYTAPETGSYTFTGSAKWKAINNIRALDSYTGNNSYFHHFTQARLVLRKYDGATNPIIQEGVITNPYYPADDAPNTFYRISNIDSVVGATWGFGDLTLEAEVNLTAGDKVYLSIEVKDDLTDINSFSYNFGNNTSLQPVNEYIYFTPNLFNDATQIDVALLKNVTFSCSNAPQTEDSILITGGAESIKSMRNIDVGVVYRDGYNRQSTVFLDETFKLNILKAESINANTLVVSLLNKAPSWAKYYKFFIKENTSEFYNLVMSQAFENNDEEADQQHAWLAFNSVDIDKIKQEDYLILKKKHNSQEAVVAAEARWKALEISNEVPETAIISDGASTVGKFFVKVKKDSAFDTYIGIFETATDPSTASVYGAVFETEPKKSLQSEETSIYWEAGQAYPIKLDIKDAESYIEVGSKITVIGSSYDVNSNTYQAIKNQFDDTNITVTNVRGAYSFDSGLIAAAVGNVNPDNTTTNPDHGYCVVNASVDLNIGITPGNYVDLQFTRKDNSFTTARAIAPTNGEKRIYLLPYTQPVTGFETLNLPKGLSWYNCFMFGNGVESDRVRDDFNADTIYEYIPSGKTSGFKASIFYDDYSEVSKNNDIIFSQIFNEKANINRFNEFLIGKSIVKQLAPEYGSIQKLFTRDSDLIAFCENKVIQILANKDELFNADGTSSVVGVDNKVLGRARPFVGDYGISKNPESFANDEFRIYFTDKARGAVLRLSRDGITNISDYGMKDWFYDNLAYGQALIGSFDGKKNEYNLTVHSVTNPESKKDVYTLSFSEDVNGWVSFKGFVKEAGATLNNFYYTFKNGKPWIHHSENVNRNLFYSKQYDSSIQPIFNDFPGSVKTFSTINYEGTQSKITQNTDSRDLNYYNLSNENGWYVKSIETDLQEGQVSEFINKEGKWFNNITGVSTTFTNAADAGAASGNLDTREISVQGIGTININPTIVSGTIDGFGFSVTLDITGENNWSVD